MPDDLCTPQQALEFEAAALHTATMFMHKADHRRRGIIWTGTIDAADVPLLVRNRTDPTGKYAQYHYELTPPMYGQTDYGAEDMQPSRRLMAPASFSIRPVGSEAAEICYEAINDVTTAVPTVQRTEHADAGFAETTQLIGCINALGIAALTGQ
jgi:hypothetical protein